MKVGLGRPRLRSCGGGRDVAVVKFTVLYIQYTSTLRFIGRGNIPMISLRSHVPIHISTEEAIMVPAFALN